MCAMDFTGRNRMRRNESQVSQLGKQVKFIQSSALPWFLPAISHRTKDQCPWNTATVKGSPGALRLNRALRDSCNRRLYGAYSRPQYILVCLGMGLIQPTLLVQFPVISANPPMLSMLLGLESPIYGFSL